jgi:quinol monooxygenase YgiN
MSVIVVATVFPEPDHRDEVLAALKETVPVVHAEDGCDLYALHEGPDRFVLIEEWASDDALAVHAGAQALADLRTRLAGKTVGDLDIQLLTAVPAGTEEQGSL